jgi:hypothetical protein
MGRNPATSITVAICGRGLNEKGIKPNYESKLWAGTLTLSMKKMLIATRGKVLTLKTLDSLADHSNLAQFRTKQA